MNLLIFSKHYYPEPFLIDELAVEIRKHIKNVYIVTSQPNYPEGRDYKGYNLFSFSKEERNGLNIYRVPVIPRFANSFFYISLNYLFFIFISFFAAAYLVASKKITHIFVYATSPMYQTFSVLVLRWFNQLKIIMWVQDIFPDDAVNNGYLKNKFAINFFRKTNNFLFRNVDLILLQSNAFKESIDIRFHDKVRYFPNPCKFENDTKPILNSKLKQIFKKNKFYISVTGNIGISQDFGTLLKAAYILQKEKNNNSIHIVIVGTGSSFIYLSRKVASLRLKNITMTGYLDKIYMPFIYSNSNVLYAGLLDRKTFSQVIPYRVSSYMASGKPIIASIGGETKQLILDAKCGFYNQPENPISLANLFLRVSKLPSSRLESMGKNGFIYASKNFDIKSNVVRLIQLMKSLS